MEEQLPPHLSQVQLLMITTKFGDFFEGNSEVEVEDDIKGEIVGGFFVWK
jgi:hypothetical protein